MGQAADLSYTVGMIDRQTAQHYSWGSGCDGWHLVQAENLSVIEERMPPGTSEIRHYHRNANQFFYVLQGSLSIEVGGSEFALSPGQGVHVPAGEPHQVLNRAMVDAEFLVVSSPPSHGDRVPA
jgi:mannose-6-phosphate isomerase-like protein (cupin superfamily)